MPTRSVSCSYLGVVTKSVYNKNLTYRSKCNLKKRNMQGIVQEHCRHTRCVHCADCTYE